MEDNLNFSQLASDFNQSCEDLARKVLSLESFIRSAVIHLSVEALVQTTEPMSRIVKAATVNVKVYALARIRIKLIHHFCYF